MTGKRVWGIFWVGTGLLITLLAIVLAGFLIPWAPDTIRQVSLNIYSMFYWLIPLIILLFCAPLILDSSRRPSIDILFELKPTQARKLEITVINMGDVPFSFNRVQFYARGTRIAVPEDGKPRHLWFRTPGDTLDREMNVDAGCTVVRGVPVTIWTSGANIDEWLIYICEQAPDKSIHCTLFFKGTKMQAKSKQGLPSDFVKSCQK